MLLVACGSSGTTDAGLVEDAAIDGGGFDATIDTGLSDAAALDTAALDAGAGDADIAIDAAADSAPDTGDEDASTEPVEGFGVISGPCGRLASEVLAAEPSLFVVTLDFEDDEFDDETERGLLTPGAQEILSDGTVGGSSEISEAFAFEVLARCEGASLIKSEGEIEYLPMDSAKTDFSATLYGTRMGVSVARAYVFPPGTPYNASEADRVLGGKLEDILESSMNVVAADSWHKQVLAVMAYDGDDVAVIRSFWEAADAAVRADTILYVVVTDGADTPIYD